MFDFAYGACGVQDSEIEHRAHFDRDVIPSDDVLRRDIHSYRAQIDARREPGFAQRYERFLTAGGSASPAELLAVVGVDLGDPEIWNDGFAVLEGFVERMC